MENEKKQVEFKPEHLAILDDPIKFCAMCWPDIKLVDYQRDILMSLRDNVETFVHAANEVGKDFTTSIGVMWFFCTRRPARVITSSSGETQLKNILWSEIRERISTSRIKFPLKIGTLSIKWINPDGTEDPSSYIIGHVTKSVENFQGHHLDHDKPRVMCVFDEASGVGDEYNEAADSWAHRKLVIGNPLNCLNFFYRSCKRGDITHDDKNEEGMLRKIIHIDCNDSPNVQLGRKLAKAGIPGPYPSVVPGVLSYAEYKRRLKIWDKIKIQIRLHGKFYEGDETLLYPPEWLDLAESVYSSLCPQGYDVSARAKPNSPALAMGVDAGAGRDLSAWSVVNREQLLFQDALPTPDTMEIVRRTIKYIKYYKLNPRRVAIDAGGGGKQIADRLREMGFHVRAVSFGEAATPLKDARNKRIEDKETNSERRQVYKNRRAEMYGLVRDVLDPSMNENVFAIPAELFELRKELAIMPLLYDNEGRMFLPPKDRPTAASTRSDIITIKKILGHSPDRADSFILAMFALLAVPVRRLVGAL